MCSLPGPWTRSRDKERIKRKANTLGPDGITEKEVYDRSVYLSLLSGMERNLNEARSLKEKGPKIKRGVIEEHYFWNKAEVSLTFDKCESPNLGFNVKMRQMLESTERFCGDDLNHLHFATVLSINVNNHRITEWLMLEGTSEDHLIQPLCWAGSPRADCTGWHPGWCGKAVLYQKILITGH